MNHESVVGATALIAAADPAAREVLRRPLADAGMRIIEAEFVGPALDLAARGPDVIFVAGALGDAGVLDLAAALKSNPLTVQIPLIQWSSAPLAEQDRVELLRAGADQYLEAPVDDEVLVANVASQLRQTETARQLELALSLEETGIYDWNVSTGAVRWTRSLERIHRMEAGSFGGDFESFEACVHADDRPHVAKVLHDAVENGDALELTFRFLRADGTHGWMESRGSVFRDTDGAAVRVLGLAHDVTDRVVDRQRIDQLRRLAADLTGTRTVNGVVDVITRELASTSVTVELTTVVDSEEDPALDAGAGALFSYLAGGLRLEFRRAGTGSTPTRRQLTAIGELGGAALERAQHYEAERSNAIAFQQALVPSSVPDSDAWWIDATYVPAEATERLGGDLFDTVPIDDAVVLVIGDIAGHGLQATQQTGTVRALLRTLVALHDGDPVTVVQSARGLFSRVCGDNAPFVSVCVARCTHDGVVTVASAGHPPPIVRRSGTAELIDMPTGPPLGVFEHASDESVRIELAEHDWVALYTDGVFERRDEPIDATIRELCGKAASVASAGDLIHLGESDANNPDDRAVVLATRRPTSSV